MKQYLINSRKSVKPGIQDIINPQLLQQHNRRFDSHDPKEGKPSLKNNFTDTEQLLLC